MLYVMGRNLFEVQASRKVELAEKQMHIFLCKKQGRYKRGNPGLKHVVLNPSSQGPD